MSTASKNGIFLIIALVVAGCSGPRVYDYQGPWVSYKDRNYIKASWASVGVQESYERCRNEVQSLRYLSHFLCMKANGYEGE